MLPDLYCLGLRLSERSFVAWTAIENSFTVLHIKMSFYGPCDIVGLVMDLVFSWIYHENLNAFIVKLYADFKIQFFNILVFLKECNMFVKESLF